jgi:hypothetical protein
VLEILSQLSRTVAKLCGSSRAAPTCR